MSEPNASGLAAIRRAFDETFAAPARAAPDDQIDLLAIRVAGQDYAVRLADVVGLQLTRKIVAVPSAMAELLGVSGLRGGLVPVYQLGVLLGHDGQPAEALSWLVLCATPELLGLAFESFAGHLRVSRSDVRVAGPSGGAATQMSQLCRPNQAVRSIIDIPATIETIKRRTSSDRAPKEREP
jgi:chemotaxis signal transduction protein